MDNKASLDSLDRVVSGSADELVRLDDSKKFTATKQKIRMICRGLTVETQKYVAENSIEQIEQYIETKDKMTRILYSEISSYLFNLEQEKRVIFLTNVEKMLICSLGKEASISEDAAKIVVKIYDHTQLVNYQIENMNDIFAQRIVDAKMDLHNEIKGIEKEYITILGIFAAIVLAFVGSFTFSTSVLNNVTNTNIYKLAFIAVVIGFVFYNLVGILIDFLKEINDKVERADNGKIKEDSTRKRVNRLLMIIILAVLLGYGLTKVTLPERVYIGTSQVQSSEINPTSTTASESGN